MKAMGRGLLFLFLISLSLGAFSQNSIKGRVLDSLTRQPIPYVNVYFANTTIGTVTNMNGEFTIKGFSSGKYIFTASYVGYTSTQLPLAFNNNELNVTINLALQTIQLTEVSVKADSSEWKENFQMFKENFLGRTKNSFGIVITNPRNLRLFFDKHDSVFVAYAKQPIEIENRNLGYKIFYHLTDFQIDYKTGNMVYRGIPRFEMLEPKSPRELNRWEGERKRAYYGSFSHLIEALKDNSLDSSGFEVSTVIRVPNKSRPSDEILLTKIASFRKRLLAVRGSTQNRTSILDSLNSYIRKFYSPKFIDSLGHKITDARELFIVGSKDVIGYKGGLQVIFNEEKEENSYTPGFPPLKYQLSVIQFSGNNIKLYENGYYEDVKDVFFDGYMGWSEKLAELLPQEYVPAEIDNKK